MSNVRLVEWDFSTDKPIDGGRCVVINSATWNVGWDGG
jgi:hypothetical protein